MTAIDTDDLTMPDVLDIACRLAPSLTWHPGESDTEAWADPLCGSHPGGVWAHVWLEYRPTYSRHPWRVDWMLGGFRGPVVTASDPAVALRCAIQRATLYLYRCSDADTEPMRWRRRGAQAIVDALSGVATGGAA